MSWDVPTVYLALHPPAGTDSQPTGVCGNVSPEFPCLFILNLNRFFMLGQHNFEFRSVSRFQGKFDGAGLISISHFTTFLPLLEAISVEKPKLR